jgi:hypothetical protein
VIRVIKALPLANGGSRIHTHTHTHTYIYIHVFAPYLINVSKNQKVVWERLSFVVLFMYDVNLKFIFAVNFQRKRYGQ